MAVTSLVWLKRQDGTVVRLMMKDMRCVGAIRIMNNSTYRLKYTTCLRPSRSAAFQADHFARSIILKIEGFDSLFGPLTPHM